jgi:hypothetical protein
VAFDRRRDQRSGAVVTRAQAGGRRWLLLIHQLPPKPDYFRVKIWRRLQRIGAVAIKNSVYVLPRSEQATEHFQWILREIEGSGGEASVCEAAFVTGLSDSQIEASFRAAREADYAALAGEADGLLRGARAERAPAGPTRTELETTLARLRRRLGEIGAIDFFGSPGRKIAAAALDRLESRIALPKPRRRRQTPVASTKPKTHRTWVTRKGVHVDRIASAWLIRRFIDGHARFKFVDDTPYQPKRGEVRFDMFEAEYTHEGDHCTFETLIASFALQDPGLRPLAEMVHDIDLRDGKFARAETAGFERLIDGICAHADDEDRIAHGLALLDNFYRSFEPEATRDRRRPTRSK